MVSDCGRVFTVSMKEKKLSRRSDGYLVTSVGGRGYPIKRVHHLVLEAFVGARPEGMEARHLNGDRSDNRLSNLAWGDRVDQILDQKKHGTFVKPPPKNGRDNPGYRGVFDGPTIWYLTTMALAINKYSQGGISMRSICGMYGVSRTHMRRCIDKLSAQKEGPGHES